MDSTFWAPLLAFALAQLLAVASPGPSFLNIVQTAVSRSRKHALAAALAMAIGAEIWALAALLGLGSLFTRLPWFYRLSQGIGGLFLLWIAIQIWRHSTDSPSLDGNDSNERNRGVWAAFRTSLGVQLSNPKPAVFFASIFVALFPRDASFALKATALAIIPVNEFAWYAFVATVLSTSRARAGYLRCKKWLDRGTTIFLAMLAVRLVFTF
jgi:threonine/homoserine/homoserine lactone efflux protein